MADPPVDRIGVALWAMGAGAAAGAALVVLGLLVYRTLQASGSELLAGGAPVLSGPLFAGLCCAAAAAWSLARPIGDAWRRGVTAALAVFGAGLLAALAAPADMVGRRPGLAAYFAVLFAGAWYAWHAARRAPSS